MRKRVLVLGVLPAVVLVCAGASQCSEDKSGAARESQATMLNQEQAAVTVGMPAIVNYTEKRMLKTIYELRDNPKLVTYSYTMDMTGKRHSVCPTVSIGYPVPYSTQYTAPKALRVNKPIWPDGTQYSGEAKTWEADQPEPNGLYMPSSADGTWVICVNPDTGNPAPVYIEPKVMTYPFKMPSVD